MVASKPDPRHGLFVFLLKNLAVTLGSMATQQLVVVLSCRALGHAEMGYVSCAKESGVQRAAAKWSLLLSLLEQVPSLLVLLVAGRLLDVAGRRLFLMVSALSVFVSCSVALRVATLLANKEVSDSDITALLIQLAASALLSGLAGGKVLFRTACSAFLVDATLPQQRTHFFLLLDAALAVAVTLGPFVGGFLATHISFSAAFAASLAVAVVLNLYLLRAGAAAAVAAVAATTTTTTTTSCCGSARRFDEIDDAVGVDDIVVRAHSDEVVERVERVDNIVVLDPRGIDAETDTTRTTLAPELSIQDNKILWEIRVLRMGLLLATLGELWFAFAPSSMIFMCGTLFSTCACFTAPTIRSMLSTFVPSTHQGRLFSSIQLFESIAAILATSTLNLIYQHTIDTWVPNAAILFMAALLAGAFVVSVFGVAREGVIGMEMGGVSEVVVYEFGEAVEGFESDSEEDESAPLLP
ncbi:hypothetical protein HDU98_007468 [Podochytrium sp. JEL0797]|nr:hypothetical protein HDU98_007468 [Podochytrium sp. JEL0797]